MFADTHCVVEEITAPHHVYRFSGHCILSGQAVSVDVPAPELFTYRQGALIQDAMKSLSADEREFLLSGISGAAFDRNFDEN